MNFECNDVSELTSVKSR